MPAALKKTRPTHENVSAATEPLSSNPLNGYDNDEDQEKMVKKKSSVLFSRKLVSKVV